MDNRNIFFRNYLLQHYLVCRRRRVTVLHAYGRYQTRAGTKLYR